MHNQLPLIVYEQAHQASATRLRLCDLPTEEQPLYRLQQHGSEALSTTELLALLLGSADGPGLAQELLSHFGSLHQLARTSKARLMQFRGIGEAQAARLMACLALCRRLQEPPADERPRITSPADGPIFCCRACGIWTRKSFTWCCWTRAIGCWLFSVSIGAA